MALIPILALYLVIGVLAAIGAVTISGQRLTPKGERILFALLLLPIAAMYLDFAAWFDAHAAFPAEGYGVLLFSAFALLGLRMPMLIVIGYFLHGAWDLVHEVTLHTSLLSSANRLTPIPLAYGVFCAAFDWFVAGYFYTRLPPWRAAPSEA